MKMTNWWLAAILCDGILSIVLSAQTATPHRECAGLTSLTLTDIKIREAVAVPAATSGEIRAAHCRVTGVIGTEIRFALLLPDAWNGKFMMGGGSAFVGTLDNMARETVNAGYATVGTDTGHQGNVWDASWALNNLERRSISDMSRCTARPKPPTQLCGTTTARPQSVRTFPAARMVAVRA